MNKPMANQSRYVCGFMFSEDRRRVLLIRKQNPEWQRGLLNGIGGKIEGNKTLLAAMRREFKEETGLQTYMRDSWTQTVSLFGAAFIVHFFFRTGPIDDARSITDEKVEIVAVDAVPTQKTIPNLRWLVSMQLDNLEWPLYIHDLHSQESEHV